MAQFRCKDVRTLAVIVMLMLAYAGCASASFRKCFSSCYEDCSREPRAVEYCIGHCIVKCIGKAESTRANGSCNNDCVVNRCHQFGNDVDKLEDCVDKSCGGNNRCV